jgi:hypothetical protein
MKEKKQITKYITKQLGQKRIDMKKVNNLNFKKAFSSIILLFLAFVLFSCSSPKDKEKIKRIYNDPGYAVGTIVSYVSIPTRVTYKYKYMVENQIYDGKEIAIGINQEDDRLINQSFLVVYNKSNVKESVLNMKYHLQSEEEFIQLLEKFKTDPPKP